MNKPTAIFILGFVFIVGLGLGSGVAYLVVGPGISTSSIPFLGSTSYTGGDIDKQYTRDYSDASGKKLLKMSLRNLGWATQRSMNMPLLPAGFTDSIAGFTFDSSFYVTLPGQGGNTMEIDVDLDSDNYFDGTSRSEINLNKPKIDGFSNVVLKQNGNDMISIFPDSQEFYQTSGNDVSEYQNTIEDFRKGLDDVTKSSETFEGKPVYVLTASDRQQKGTVLVSKTPPHTIYQINSGNGGDKLNLRYRSDQRKQLQSISITQQSGQKTKMTFNYDGSEIQNIRVEENRGTVVLSFVHGSNFSRGFDVEIPNQPEANIEARWGFQDGLPARARLNVNAPAQGQTFEAGLELTNMTWPESAGSISFSAPSNYTELNDQEIRQKVMPIFTQLMMAGMNAQQQLSQ